VLLSLVLLQANRTAKKASDWSRSIAADADAAA